MGPTIFRNICYTNTTVDYGSILAKFGRAAYVLLVTVVKVKAYTGRVSSIGLRQFLNAFKFFGFKMELNWCLVFITIDLSK